MDLPQACGREGSPDQPFKRSNPRLTSAWSLVTSAITDLHGHWYTVKIMTVPGALRDLSEVPNLLV